MTPAGIAVIQKEIDRHQEEVYAAREELKRLLEDVKKQQAICKIQEDYLNELTQALMILEEN